MKKSEFSEKLYETLCIHELLNIFSNSAIYCPSQNKEGKLGYDALFNVKRFRKVIVIQFKVAEKYLKEPKYFSPGRNCYKFNIHQKNNCFQHNRLVTYNRGKKYIALYCTPKFVGFKELYSYCQKSNLINNSALLYPQIKINDQKYHFINYCDSAAYQHSKKLDIVQMLSLDILCDLVEKLDGVSANEFEQIVSGCDNKVSFLLI